MARLARRIGDITNEEFAAEMNKVLERIEAGERTWINNHNGREEQLEGYVILEGCNICPVIKRTQYYSLNPLYLSKKDNKIHISTASIGGTIVNIGHDSAEAAIIAYKEQMESNPFGRKVTDYKVF